LSLLEEVAISVFKEELTVPYFVRGSIFFRESRFRHALLSETLSELIMLE
jgi:hypothetical protein